jgi:hypothetical protein
MDSCARRPICQMSDSACTPNRGCHSSGGFLYIPDVSLPPQDGAFGLREDGVPVSAGSGGLLFHPCRSAPWMGQPRWVGGLAGNGRALRDAHLSDDKAVAKMGHPSWWFRAPSDDKVDGKSGKARAVVCWPQTVTSAAEAALIQATCSARLKPSVKQGRFCYRSLQSAAPSGRAVVCWPQTIPHPIAARKNGAPVS